MYRPPLFGTRDDSQREPWHTHPLATFLLWAAILLGLVVIVVALWLRNFHPTLPGFGG